MSERLPLGLEPTEVSLGDKTLPGVGPPANPTAPSAAPLGTGELGPGDLVGRYVIERKVGAGGMGEVYAAHDPQLDRRVAIKVLRPSGRASDAAARLVREAQALAKLAHPNVVAVHDVGEADERVFLAMQFVEGSTLGDHIARTALAPEEIVRLYVAAGRGLAAAHAAGLIHRDMKPSNVLIDRAGHVAVTDFGVARASDDFATPEPHPPSGAGPHDSSTGRSALSTDMTQAGAVIGTPSYMAPEQHAGRRATAKSDQFGFCVSLWQGLYGKHPFVPHDHDEETSPFEYMALISEGVLVPPRKQAGVPRRVVAALTRGLARDPDARWPSMAALLAELEPPSRYRSAVVALAAVATIGAGAALWFALGSRGADPSSCRTAVGERVETAWSRDRAAAIADGFARTDRPYAAVTATATATGLDAYAQRWSAVAIDACAGAASREPADQQLARARAQCLDRGLGALRSVASLLATSPRAELVDHALQVVGGLPALDDCTDPAALLAGGAPPADRAVAIAALEDRLVMARAKLDAGLFREAGAELEALVADADAAQWPSLRVRVRLALGDVKLGSFDPGLEILLEAARLATEHGLDREAAKAWSALISGAAIARRPDAADAYTEIATAAAAATHDPSLVNRVRVYRGRALVRMRRFTDAEPHCRAALSEARTRPGVEWRELASARDCLLEVLMPLGKFDEAEALAAEAIADRAALISAEHPAIGDYLAVIARGKQSQGQLAEAEADYERVHALRLRAFGPRHLKSAESVGDLAGFERDLAKRKAMLEAALTIVVAPDSQTARTPLVEYRFESMLAEIAGKQDDHAAMQRHFERAVALAEGLAGPTSLDVAMLLVGYGQHLSAVDLDRSLATLRRAETILDGLHDPRAEIARGALALILTNAARYREALPLLERALAATDRKNTEPMNLAMMRFNLATALVETRGDRERARALATQALATYRTLGPGVAGNVTRIERWLARN